MARKNEQKGYAEDMFIEQGMTAKAIADILKVQEKTVGKWRKLGNWDDRREQNLAAPHKIRELLLKEIRKISEGQVSTVDADALSKFSKVIEQLSSKLSPQTCMSVLTNFDNWMVDHDPKLAIEFLKYHKLYLQHIMALNDE